MVEPHHEESYTSVEEVVRIKDHDKMFILDEKNKNKMIRLLFQLRMITRIRMRLVTKGMKLLKSKNNLDKIINIR